jgi:hypothetical protein
MGQELWSSAVHGQFTVLWNAEDEGWGEIHQYHFIHFFQSPFNISPLEKPNWKLEGQKPKDAIHTVQLPGHRAG